jgi:hypothetical protein
MKINVWPRPSRLTTLASVTVVLIAAFGACDKSSPTKPSPVPCSFALSSQSQSFSSDGGTGSVNITTGAQCEWAVEGGSGWVTLLSAANGTGPASVSFRVLANDDQSAREKTLMVAALPFKISQDAHLQCTYAISPEQHTVDDDGGTGEVQVTATEGCTWNAQSNDAWISINEGSQGRGNGIVEYSVVSNAGPASRKGTLTIASRTHTVNQDGQGEPPPADCRYSVAPVAFTPCMPGGELTAAVTTQANCPWTAAPGMPWLSLRSGAAGSGSGTVTIRFTDNYDAPREGVVMVRWPTPSQGQNIHVAQAGCIYAVSRDSLSFTAAGGSGTFDVLQQSQPTTCGSATQDRCIWTAESSAPWIVVTTTMPQAGDNPVALTVAANTGAARTGTVTVRGKTVTITQAAP